MQHARGERCELNTVGRVQWLRHGPCPSKAHLRLVLGDVAALMCLYLSWAYNNTLPVPPLSETVSTGFRHGAGNCRRCLGRHRAYRSRGRGPEHYCLEDFFEKHLSEAKIVEIAARFAVPTKNKTRTKSHKRLQLLYDALCPPCLVGALASLPIVISHLE